MQTKQTNRGTELEQSGRIEARELPAISGAFFASFVRHAIASSLILVASCGLSRLPRPPYTAHASADLVAIPYPPPPARIEVIPESPDDRAVWLDGEWSWSGRRWGWRRGRWVIPPQGAAFAPWQAVRGGKGNLFIAPGVWKGKNGELVEEPLALGEAKGTRLPIVNLDGEEEPIGADIRAERRPEDGGVDGAPRVRDRDRVPARTRDEEKDGGE